MLTVPSRVFNLNTPEGLIADDYELKYTELSFAVWNVRGLACKTNNKLIETDFRKATRDADIILISETWGKPSQNIQLDGYEVILCHKVNTDPREKRGSGGIAALIKTKVFPKINVYKSFKDLYMWLQVKCINHTLFISFMYVPPGSVVNNSNEDTVFDMLLRDQAQIKSKFGPNVAFGSCGDTNLHTGTEDDFVPGDDGRYAPLYINYEEDIPLKRFSKDPLCTSSGRVQLSYCQEGNFRILNGRVGKDKGVGEVTFSSHVGSKPSVIDYVMMSPDYMHNVTQFEVGSNYLLSDHYPILWSYKIAPSTDRDAKQTGEKPLRWSEEKKVAATLAIDCCMPRLSEILESSESLSTITEQFTNTLYEAVRPVLQLGAKQLNRARPGVVGGGAIGRR